MGVFVVDSAWKTLPNLPVVAGTYVSADGSLSITVDQKGRVTSITSNAQTIGASMIQNSKVSSEPPIDGDMLIFGNNNWYPTSSGRGVSGGWMPSQEITEDGGTIVAGINRSNVSATSQHTIDSALQNQSFIKIYNVQGYDTKIVLPEGWQFSDGSYDITLGFLANCSLAYYGGNIVYIESKHDGATP